MGRLGTIVLEMFFERVGGFRGRGGKCWRFFAVEWEYCTRFIQVEGDSFGDFLSRSRKYSVEDFSWPKDFLWSGRDSVGHR